jgi:hypothetical protein
MEVMAIIFPKNRPETVDAKLEKVKDKRGVSSIDLDLNVFP